MSKINIKVKPRADTPPNGLAAYTIEQLLAEVVRRQPTRITCPVSSLRPLARFRCLPDGCNIEGTLLGTTPGSCCKILVSGEGGKERIEYWSEASLVIPTGEIMEAPPQPSQEQKTRQSRRDEERHTEVLSRKELKALVEKAAASLPQVAAPQKSRVDV